MSTRIKERMRTAVLPDGTRALVVDCEIPDDAPAEIREGLARRALSNSGQTCPCGARWPLPNREQRRRMKEPGVTYLQVEHENDCPAGNEILIPLIRAWEATR